MAASWFYRDRIGAGCLVVSLFATPAWGQTELRPVDSGTARSGPLSAPGRTAPTDLRAPSAFDRVYRVMSGGKDTGRYARVQGAITAEFSGSQYTGSNANEVPAGTIFHIGAPRELSQRPPAESSARMRQMPTRAVGGERVPASAPVSTAANNSARAALRAPTPIRSNDAPPVPLSMFTDDTYRARLVGTLLDRALVAPKG